MVVVAADLSTAEKAQLQLFRQEHRTKTDEIYEDAKKNPFETVCKITMEQGKYNGYAIADLAADEGYLKWCKSHTDRKTIKWCFLHAYIEKKEEMKKRDAEDSRVRDLESRVAHLERMARVFTEASRQCTIC